MTSAARRRSGPHPPSRGEVQDERQDQRRDEQQQPERRLEADAHQAAPPAAVRAGAAEPATQADHGVAVVEGPLDAQDDQDDRTIGTHSSSRVVGRSVAAPPAAPLAPGDGRCAAVVPSASIAAAEPGRWSIRSSRTGRPRSGPAPGGSCGIGDADADVPAEALGVVEALGEAGALGRALAEGAGDASGSKIGVTVYTPSRSVAAKVTARPPVVARDELGRRAIRPRDGQPVCAARDHQLHRSRRAATASVGAVEPPSSSPVRLASRIGNATWSGRSERRGSKASTAVGTPSRTPAYSSGAPPGPGMTVRAHVGRRQPGGLARCGSSRGRRSAGSARRVEACRCPGSSACRSPRRGRSTAAARSPGSGVRAASPAGSPRR